MTAVHLISLIATRLPSASPQSVNLSRTVFLVYLNKQADYIRSLRKRFTKKKKKKEVAFRRGEGVKNVEERRIGKYDEEENCEAYGGFVRLSCLVNGRLKRKMCFII